MTNRIAVETPWVEKAQPVPLMTLGMVSMSVPLCKQIYVLLTKDERFLISKQHATVASSSPDLATFFASEAEARDYLGQLEVRNSANLKLFQLYEWCIRLINKRRIHRAEDTGGEAAEEIP
jgi:hypothetical protein